MQLAPKVAKGARDTLPPAASARNAVVRRLTDIFRRHGASEMDTPVFELSDTLHGAYGAEARKLIYDLADQGGEQLSLRYDLTVPFARYMCTHNLSQCRRYQVGKVYRRDQPQPNKGRFREFTQCDFDIAGRCVPMAAEAETMLVVQQAMAALQVSDYTVRVNHRTLLAEMLSRAGIDGELSTQVCSSLDKLDKQSWDSVRRELTLRKGVPPDVADALYTTMQKPHTFVHGLPESHAGRTALRELEALLQDTPIGERLKLDLGLARGLEYYTGLIYEVIIPDAAVGAVAAGGRYQVREHVPAVGVSFGLDRLLTVLPPTPAACATTVLVVSVGPGLFKERWALARQLWADNITAEYSPHTPDPNLRKQLGYAKSCGIPHVLILGRTEIQQDAVKLKCMTTGVEDIIARHRICDVLTSYV